MDIDDIRKRATLTVKETADALGISVRHAYELVKRGDIPSLKLGHRTVVPTEKLLKMLGGDE